MEKKLQFVNENRMNFLNQILGTSWDLFLYLKCFPGGPVFI